MNPEKPAEIIACAGDGRLALLTKLVSGSAAWIVERIGGHAGIAGPLGI